MDATTFAATIKAGPAAWADLRVVDLTAAQLTEIALAKAQSISDPHERTTELLALSRTLANKDGGGIQRDVREATTAVLAARLQAGERRKDVAAEAGYSLTRLRQVLAGNGRTEAQKTAEVARRQEAALVLTSVDAALDAERTRGDSHATPAQKRRAMLDARKAARAHTAAQHAELVHAARTAHPSATNSELAVILTRQLGRPVTRQHVTAWTAGPQQSPPAQNVLRSTV